MNRIFTAGYAGHTVAQLKIVAQELDAVVVDIRMSPRSRVPEWNGVELEQAFGERYFWLRAWGNKAYGSGRIEIANFSSGSVAFQRFRNKRNAILLCGCKEYSSCHRATISRILASAGAQTEELVWPELTAPGAIKALSIRQPWAWLIVNGHKDIENRDWPTRYRGRVLIHASKSMTRYEYDDCFELCRRNRVLLPAPVNLERGGIVGEAEIVDCVTTSESPWFFGTYGFVLANAKPLPFVPLRGALMFFDVDAALLESAA